MISGRRKMEASKPVMRCLLYPILMAVILSLPLEGGVVITDSTDEGMEAFRIETPAAVYYYQKEAGGFSSILDPEGNDWIGYRDSGDPRYPDSAASDYRGLPNLVFQGEDDGAGHPGFRACRSEVTAPDTIQSQSNSGLWAWEWRFRESYAELRILEADPSRAYWFLYEGTPSGRYRPGEQYWGTDRGGPRHDIPDYLAGQEIYGKWRWAYFGDASFERVLFVANRQMEPSKSEMGYLGSDRDGPEAKDGMVVFGFGRDKGAVPLLKGKAVFFLGFYPKKMETAESHERLEGYIESLLQSRSADSGN